MIGIPRPISTAQALDYYSREGRSFSVFVEHAELRPTFGGSLLPRLGLKAGEFNEDEYAAFVMGDFPAIRSGDLKLARVTDMKSLERAAYDVTLNFEKTVGLQFLVSGDLRLLGAIRAANEKVMRYFERFARVRVTNADGDVELVHVAGIAYATFWHISSRERIQDDANDIGPGADPHLHAHNIVSKLVLPKGSIELSAMAGYDIQIAAGAATDVDGGDTQWQLKKEVRA